MTEAMALFHNKVYSKNCQMQSIMQITFGKLKF